MRGEGWEKEEVEEWTVYFADAKTGYGSKNFGVGERRGGNGLEWREEGGWREDNWRRWRREEEKGMEEEGMHWRKIFLKGCFGFFWMVS